jgi:nitrogen fixation NifU-like protein
MATKTLYPDIIREHYHNPRHKGQLDVYTHISDVVHPSCGDTIQVQVYIEDGVVKKAAFTGTGCMLSQGSASLWAEYIHNKPIAELTKLTPADILPCIGIECGLSRRDCVFLFVQALQAAVKK